MQEAPYSTRDIATGQPVRHCSVEGCGREYHAKSYCLLHYTRQRRHGDPGVALKAHNNGAACAVDSCEREAIRRRMCNLHYMRWLRYGATTDPRKARMPRRTGQDGYVQLLLPDHPKAIRGRVAEHRAVMEAHLGRFLLDHETVHHINGVRGDNRLDNLELWSSSHPPGQRVDDKVRWAYHLLRLYEPTLLRELRLFDGDECA